MGAPLYPPPSSPAAASPAGPAWLQVWQRRWPGFAVSAVVALAAELTEAGRKALSITHPGDADLGFLYGTIITDGADLKPAVAIKVMKVTTSAYQAGWSFFVIGRGYLVASVFSEEFFLDIS